VVLLLLLKPKIARTLRGHHDLIHVGKIEIGGRHGERRPSRDAHFRWRRNGRGNTDHHGQGAKAVHDHRCSDRGGVRLTASRAPSHHLLDLPPAAAELWLHDAFGLYSSCARRGAPSVARFKCPDPWANYRNGAMWVPAKAVISPLCCRAGWLMGWRVGSLRRHSAKFLGGGGVNGAWRAL
jgi:hypothetical protein